jgi:tetratricopeptide (TPR) repeat protein
MRLSRWSVALIGILLALLVPVFLDAQVDKIVIPAGTPEDHDLQAISNEPDAQKRLAMYQDFAQKYASNPAAVAFGNWQISQSYQTAGDLPKALDYGDKALGGAPHNLDILVSQTNVAQQMKNNGKLMDYAVRGGVICNSVGKQAKAEGMSDQEFASHVEEEKNSAKNSCEFLEAAAYNAIAAESDAKARMGFIEHFTPAFPNSRFEDQITSYAMVSLSELKDTSRLVAYGEKALAANPNSLATLLLLANTYVEDPKPGSLSKAVTYAQKAIEVAKADAPDADRSRKVSAGVAHYTLGYAYLKQEKATAAVPELKAASALLKGQDDQQYALTLYRLGFAYAKLNRTTEARDALTEAVKISGPAQQPAQDLLAKVNAARAKGK